MLFSQLRNKQLCLLSEEDDCQVCKQKHRSFFFAVQKFAKEAEKLEEVGLIQNIAASFSISSLSF